MIIKKFSLNRIIVLSASMERFTEAEPGIVYPVNHQLGIGIEVLPTDQSEIIDVNADITLDSRHKKGEHIKEDHKLFHLVLRNNFTIQGDSGWPIDRATSKDEVIVPPEYFKRIIDTSIGNTRGYFSSFALHLGVQNIHIPLFELEEFYNSIHFYKESKT